MDGPMRTPASAQQRDINATAVTMPFAAPETFGTLAEVAPGILWARLPLPYQPGHVNTYLIDEGDGWCAVDAGLHDDVTRATWDRIIANLPHHRTIKRVLITHWHSDHSGAAGWLCRRFAAPLLMSETEYFKCLLLEFFPRAAAAELERRHFLLHGLDPETTEEWVSSGHKFLHMAAPMPHAYHRLVAGDRLMLGERGFVVRTAPGHSPEEVMLRAAAGDVYLCADQLGPKIAPNIAVQSADPLGDPLTHYLRSLDDIAADHPGGALFLPGHEVPFRGFAARAAELRAYYARRCAVVEAACAEAPKTACELVSKLFRKPPGPVWIGFVMSEALTYANHLAGQGRLVRHEDQGLLRFASPG